MTTQEEINIIADEFNLTEAGNEAECFAKALTLCQKFARELDALRLEDVRLRAEVAGLKEKQP